MDEPNVGIFEQIEQASLELSEEQKFDLAVCLTIVQGAGVSWPKVQSPSITQEDLKRVKKIREKAHRAMKQWTACRDLLEAMKEMGFSTEKGKLALVGQRWSGTMKIIGV